MVNCKSWGIVCASVGTKTKIVTKKKRWKAINNETEKSILCYIPTNTFIYIDIIMYTNATIDNKSHYSSIGSLYLINEPFL